MALPSYTSIIQRIKRFKVETIAMIISPHSIWATYGRVNGLRRFNYLYPSLHIDTDTMLKILG